MAFWYGYTDAQTAACTMPELASKLQHASGGGEEKPQNQNDALAVMAEMAMHRTGKKKFRLDELV